jgi:hypothetical protein
VFDSAYVSAHRRLRALRDMVRLVQTVPRSSKTVHSTLLLDEGVWPPSYPFIAIETRQKIKPRLSNSRKRLLSEYIDQQSDALMLSDGHIGD